MNAENGRPVVAPTFSFKEKPTNSEIIALIADKLPMKSSDNIHSQKTTPGIFAGSGFHLLLLFDQDHDRYGHRNRQEHCQNRLKSFHFVPSASMFYRIRYV